MSGKYRTGEKNKKKSDSIVSESETAPEILQIKNENKGGSKIAVFLCL